VDSSSATQFELLVAVKGGNGIDFFGGA